jgi:DNA-binding transcriptional MocR family regulator
MDSARVLERALAEEKVAFVPGAAFFARGGGENTMRLNFSYSPTDVIDEGIRRLGRAIDRARHA